MGEQALLDGRTLERDVHGVPARIARLIPRARLEMRIDALVLQAVVRELESRGVAGS